MYTQTKIKMGCQKMLDNIQQVLAFKEVSIPFFCPVLESRLFCWGTGVGREGMVASRDLQSLA